MKKTNLAKKWKRTIGAMLIACSMVLSLAACGQTGTTTETGGQKDTTQTSGQTIKVGLLAPLTGASSSWGQRVANGFNLAAKLYNEAGGVSTMGGAKIEAVVVDTETDTEVAQSQAEKLIQDDDIMVLSGCNQSAATLVVTQVCERAGVPFLTASDGEPTITTRGFKTTFRIATLFSDYATSQVEYIDELNKKAGGGTLKLACLSINSVNGQTANETACEVAKSKGWEVVANDYYDPETTTDFTGYISKYKESGVDVLLCDSNTDDAIRIVQTMKELDFNPKALGGMYGSLGNTADFWDALGDDASYILGTTNFNMQLNVEGLEEVKAAYKAEYNEEMDDISILGVVAFAAISKAIENAGTADRAAIRDAMEQLEMAMGENNLFTVDGLQFNDNHDNAKAKAVIEQYVDGAAKLVYPAEISETEAVFPKPTWSEIAGE